MKRKGQAVRLPIGTAQDKSLDFARDKRSPQAGQAMLFALILLAIGALVVIPALRLSGTSLKASQIIVQRSKALYATDAAQEYVMWKLLHTGYTSNFTYDGQSDNFTVDVCGSLVPVKVVMRAIPTWHGVTLIRDTPIKPTKTVSGPDIDGVYTYTIKLEQISDNVSRGMDAVYDILPSYTSASSGAPYYDYQVGTSILRVGGSQLPIPDPAVTKVGGNLRLLWPATYNYSTGAGGFTSPTSNFTNGQIKEIEFKVKPSSLGSNVIYYNWVALKPWDTLSGPTAPVVTGTGANPSDGLLTITKSVLPNILLAGQTADVTYTVNITNLQGNNNHIERITDYLPPGFSYVGPTTGIPLNNFTQTFEVVNGIARWKLDWVLSGAGWSIAGNPPGNVLTFTFVARASANVSGSYYNEMLVIPSTHAGTVFSDIGISDEDFSSGYSWNSAPVIVPVFDSSASSGNVTTNANLSISTGGGAISSYQIR